MSDDVMTQAEMDDYQLSIRVQGALEERGIGNNCPVISLDDIDTARLLNAVMEDVAPLVVAAELRRMADLFPAVSGSDRDPAYETGKYVIRNELLKRAAELDPQGGTR